MSTRRLRLWYPAAAAAVLLAFIAVAGPDRVMAGVNRLLAYVPGFGVRQADTVNLAAAHPVRVQRDGVTVEVRGLLADANGTTVNFAVQGDVPLSLTSPYLQDSDGRRYDSAGGSLVTAGGRGGRTVRAWLAFKPALPPDTRQVTLVLTGPPDWRVDVPLIRGSDLTPAEQFGPAATVNGTTIAARVQALPDQTAVTLLVRGGLKGAVPSGIGRWMGDIPATRMPELVEPRSQRYVLQTDGGSSPGELWHLTTGPLPAQADAVTLTIPLLQLRQDVSGKVTVPLPPRGSPANLDLPVRLGDWTLRLTRAEVVENGASPELRLYVDPGPAGTTALASVNGLSVDGKPSSSTVTHDPQTGRIQWFAVPLPEGRRRVTITLREVVVYLTGPWEIRVPVQR